LAGVSLRGLLFLCTALGFLCVVCCFFARVEGLFAWGCLSPRTQRNGGWFRRRMITTGGCAKQSWFAASENSSSDPPAIVPQTPDISLLHPDSCLKINPLTGAIGRPGMGRPRSFFSRHGTTAIHLLDGHSGGRGGQPP